MVRRLVRGAFDQEEAQQDVWLHLYRVRAQVDVNRPDDFVAWVRQVARNRTIDFLKARSRAAREIPVDDPQKEGAGIVASGAPQNPEAQASRDALRKAIATFVDGLDEEGQRFFQLCFVEERSHQEIAKELSIAERRSKYLKKKLLAQLLSDEALRAHAGKVD